MKIREHINALKNARAEYHKKAATLTAVEIAQEVEKFKKLNQKIVDLITEGAKPCPDCGNAPHGIFHDGTPNPFEIGCLSCPNHRIREALPEDAVEKWNAAQGGAEGEEGGYMPKREPGTAVATHRDLTGEVISEKTVKVQTPGK